MYDFVLTVPRGCCDNDRTNLASNSLSVGMLNELDQALFQDNESLRCVILQSSLQKVYSAGHDLKDLVSHLCLSTALESFMFHFATQFHLVTVQRIESSHESV
jgi:enoyl-CoA hydratase/carnithine racemase